MVHPVTAYALRVEAGGRTLAYSGDSGLCPGLDDTARDADLFLCEASFLEGAPNPPDLHLTGAEAGRTAAGAGAQRLLLTHIPPWHDPQVVLGEAVGEYDGKVELATARHVVRRLDLHNFDASRSRKSVALSGIVGRVITLENVTKRYGAFTAVDDVSFTAQPGRVTGFLGPNGAGKSTSMRVMVGLTPPNGGRATIGGHLYSEIPNPARHVGVLLDASAQHAGRTGREVLRISADTMGVGPQRVEEMLELVGLSGTEAKRRVRNYSLGMRQRLGIANAFLGDPSVLILDEPVNGLDPAGIHWMRGLLRQFASQGGTVLLSSHLLHEVEMIADDMVLIGRGKIVAQGTKAELLQTRGTYVKPEDPGALLPGAPGRRHRGHPVRRRRVPLRGRAGRRRPRRGGRRRRARRAQARRGRRPRGDVPPAHLRRRPREHHRRRSPGMNITPPTDRSLPARST